MISALLVSLWSSEILLATRNCKNFWITLKLRKVCKKFKSRAALLCLKSTFSNLRTNLTIVSPYRFRITWNNDNVLGNLRRTKNIKTNAIVSALPVAWDFFDGVARLCDLQCYCSDTEDISRQFSFIKTRSSIVQF